LRKSGDFDGIIGKIGKIGSRDLLGGSPLPKEKVEKGTAVIRFQALHLCLGAPCTRGSALSFVTALLHRYDTCIPPIFLAYRGVLVISIVVPVYNEVESLPQLHKEIVAMADAHQYTLEMIFVDDGSRDASWECIQNLGKQDARVRGIKFRRNFGKAAALSAGTQSARGEFLVTLDADLQDDPAEIPRFLAELEKGLDVVSGWKKVRHDPWHKVGPSRIFNFMVSWLTGVYLHDHNCGMKGYRTQVFREIRLYGELHRFIPVLADAKGFKTGELVINHRARKFGHSKYGVARFVKGFLDLLTVKFLTGFGNRPQHILGTCGFLAFGLGLAGLFYLAVVWTLRIIYPDHFDPIHRRPLLVYSAAALIMGVQVMSIGFLAELITAYQSRDEDAYSIADRLEHSSADGTDP
jgi:dolichol-phosphate mannosyltransferase